MSPGREQLLHSSCPYKKFWSLLPCDNAGFHNRTHWQEGQSIKPEGRKKEEAVNFLSTLIPFQAPHRKYSEIFFSPVEMPAF